MSTSRTFLATSLATLTAAATAHAGPCAGREGIARALADKYGENRQSLGLSGSAQVFELFVSPRGSWTLVTTDTKGTSCIVAAGEAWQTDRKALTGLES